MPERPTPQRRQPRWNRGLYVQPTMSGPETDSLLDRISDAADESVNAKAAVASWKQGQPVVDAVASAFLAVDAERELVVGKLVRLLERGLVAPTVMVEEFSEDLPTPPHEKLRLWAFSMSLMLTRLCSVYAPEGHGSPPGGAKDGCLCRWCQADRLLADNYLELLDV